MEVGDTGIKPGAVLKGQDWAMRNANRALHNGALGPPARECLGQEDPLEKEMASWTQLSNFPFTFPFSKNRTTGKVLQPG